MEWLNASTLNFSFVRPCLSTLRLADDEPVAHVQKLRKAGSESDLLCSPIYLGII